MKTNHLSVVRRFVAGIVLPLVLGASAPEAAAAETRDILLPAGTDTVWHGVWLPIKRTINVSQITTFEAQAGKKVGAEIFYTGWYVNAWADLQRQINVWEPLGIKTMVVWEPALKNGGNPLTAILSGSQNAIIDDFARQARNYGRPFFLRFAHEMNGNWYAWSGASSGGNPQKYIDAWRYVWTRFQAAGATNAVWVWAPNWNSVPDESWNALQNYYPGDAYVDWVGVDFFGLMWDDVPVSQNLDAVYATYSHKPIMIAETAAADCNNRFSGATRTKDQWISELFGLLPSRPAVRAFFWFNDNKPGESDWTIASCPNPAAQNAYRAGVAQARYVARP
jgi:hypothetical protein